MVNETKHKSIKQSGQTFFPIQSTVSAIIAVAGEGPLDGRSAQQGPMVKGQLTDS